MDKELKKEAFEYAYNKTQKLHSSSERDFVYEIYLEIAEPREKVEKQLREENAELKEQNIKDCENFNKTMKETKEQWNEEHYQLTEAKKIIKDLLFFLNKFYSEDCPVCMDEAEQFLKDCEVEK